MILFCFLFSWFCSLKIDVIIFGILADGLTVGKENKVEDLIPQSINEGKMRGCEDGWNFKFIDSSLDSIKGRKYDELPDGCDEWVGDVVMKNGFMIEQHMSRFVNTCNGSDLGNWNVEMIRCTNVRKLNELSSRYKSVNVECSNGGSALGNKLVSIVNIRAGAKSAWWVK